MKRYKGLSWYQLFLLYIINGLIFLGNKLHLTTIQSIEVETFDELPKEVSKS